MLSFSDGFKYALFFFLGIASFFLNAKKERSNVRVWVRKVPNTKIFFIPLSEKKIKFVILKAQKMRMKIRNFQAV